MVSQLQSGISKTPSGTTQTGRLFGELNRVKTELYLQKPTHLAVRMLTLPFYHG